jgi:hypothetical protein
VFWHSKILPFIKGELRGCAWEPHCAWTFSSSLTDIRFPHNLHKQNIKPKLVATSKNRAAIVIPAIQPGVQKRLLPATTAALAGDFTGELCTITGGGDCTGEAGGVDKGVGESKGGAGGVDTGVGESKGGAGGVDEGVGESKGGAVGVNEGVGETNGGGNWVNGGGGTTDGGGGRDCGGGGRDGGGGGAGEVLN